MKNKYFITFLVYFLLPLSGLGIDIYVPSLPAISDHFHVDKAYAQLTVTVYMIGLGTMQLFAGGISDSYGRRNPYIIAMTFFIISTILVPFSHNIHQLLALRFFQGSAVALSVVPLRSVVMDLFEGRELRKMLNYMTMAWAIGPIIAPMIGGYLQHYFGWKAPFHFLFGYAAFFFVITLFFLPETSKHKHPFHIGSIIKRNMSILSHKSFMLSVITASFLYSLILMFNVIGPFLIQTVLHFNPIVYGKIAMFMGIIWFVGTIINRFLLDIPIHIKAKHCFNIMIILCLMMLFVSWDYPLNIFRVVIPTASIILFAAIVFPNYFQKCMAFFPTITGSANAVFGSVIFLVSGASSGVAALLKSDDAVPMAFAFLAITLICVLLHFMNREC